MATPLLATKLYRPLSRPEAVRRLRRTERLIAGLHRKPTLIAAPAGFGKTALVAWLSLDDPDSDPTRFLTYLVAALQTIAPTSGAGVVGAFQAPQPPPAEAILTARLHDLTAVPDPFVLVLDDYHDIDATAVDSVLTFLLEHLPP